MRSASRRCVERGLTPAQAQAAAPALAALHETLLRGGRGVEIRTFHAWFAQLLRAAPLELLADLGLQRDAELVEDPAEHCAAVHRRFHAALLRDAALRADHAALVARRGRHQARRWLDALLDKRIEFELADAAGTLDDSVVAAARLWPALAGLAHPTDVLAGGTWRADLEALARALGQGKKPARDAADGIVDALALLERPVEAWPRLRAALFTNEDRRSRASWSRCRDWPRCTRHSRNSPRRPTSTSRTSNTFAWCDSAGCCSRNTRPTSASAVSPTWPTWSAVRSRCCATAICPAGSSSAWMRACATC